MASRSSRRRIKEPETPKKLDDCQNDNNDMDEKVFETGLRRSLRHSPGSSLSHHKTKRVKGSPSGVENKSPKSSPNSSMHSTHSSGFIDDLQQNEGVSTNTRTSSACKSSHISPNSIISTERSRASKNASNSSSSPSLTSTSVATPRRSTRNKVVCDSSNAGDILKDKSLEMSNCHPPDSTKLSIDPSTSHSHKRNLLSSPDSSDTERANGTSDKSQSCKNKRFKYDESFNNYDKEILTNTICRVNSEKNMIDKSDAPVSKNFSCVSTISSSFLEGTHQKISNNSQTIKLSSKRILIDESPENSKHSKKSRIDTKIGDNSYNNKESKAENGIDNVLVGSAVEKSAVNLDFKASIPLSLKSNNLSNLLVGELCLNQDQYDEINSMVSSDYTGSSYIAIIENLMQILLNEDTSISSMSSPRFNKFLRQLILKYCSFDISIEKKHQICQNALEWSKERKSVNLRHELELTLMALYYDTKFYRKAEEVATALYKETKKLQDKEKTVKACLCLSKAYHAMGNISKARANITTAKTEALKIYTPPDLQAELDLQSGIMQVAEEKDMETAFSYFKEAATGSTVQKLRSRALKYMLLTKLLINKPEEGEKAVKNQSHINDIDLGVEAMLSITKAATLCSLADFKSARDKYGNELEEDMVVRSVLDELYTKMLEKNLLNIISPYGRMQIAVIAEKIGLVREEVERRLSQMILDGKISAQLDHRDDCLYVYEKETKDSVYENSIDTVSQLDKTLSLLSKRVKQLL